MGNLLMRYLRLAINEAQARVPNQLISDDGASDHEDQEIEEFSGAGAVMGCPAPADQDKRG